LAGFEWENHLEVWYTVCDWGFGSNRADSNRRLADHGWYLGNSRSL